jgi:hypothetical protein
MTNRSNTTMQEFTTALPVDEVIARAKSFFAKRSSLYAAFLDREGPGYCTFRGQGGEEIAIGATSANGATRVTGSTYLFDMQVSRFFETLPAVQASGT